MGMKPITIALDGDTASYLVLALKEELAEGRLQPTTARVYREVIDAVVAAFDPPAPNLHIIDPNGTPAPSRGRRSQSSG